MSVKIIVVGVSTGALVALTKILTPLPSDFCIPVVIVRHQPPTVDDTIVSFLGSNCRLKVQYAKTGETPAAGCVYLAPPDRHLQFASDGTFELLDTPKVNFSRPSVDLLFESAALVFGTNVAGVILTGANADGAEGLKTIKQYGGLTIVQNPKSAEAAIMPDSAIQKALVDHIIWIDQIGPFLWDIHLKARKVNPDIA
ncbi:MAG: chemotaxis protein CheB [Desulfatitalea sp.]|nr:chemotaxis protein CheB [Desulfatitalea sp.]NNJ99200.1 chemotaxis protein CheB [Desulfatitalea sp.]